jgi:thioredoxin-related protein
MKRLMFAFSAALVLLAFSPIDELAIGSKLPKAEVKMTDISGKEITLGNTITKNGLLVMFSCNTCPYVIKNQERTRQILAYAQSKKMGVAVLNSNEASRGKEDSYDAMKAYGKDQQYNWIYAIDKNHVLADAFGATRTPECFLFDGNGVLVYHGAIDDSPTDAGAVKRTHLKEAIDEMTAGKQITVTTSRSIGCSIKRLSNP